jgi:hypothetical protein
MNRLVLSYLVAGFVIVLEIAVGALALVTIPSPFNYVMLEAASLFAVVFAVSFGGALGEDSRAADAIVSGNQPKGTPGELEPLTSEQQVNELYRIIKGQGITHFITNLLWCLAGILGGAFVALLLK